MRTQGVVEPSTPEFTFHQLNQLKFVKFYKSTYQQKIDCWNKLKILDFISCHRQYEYDFSELDPNIQVVSIVMDNVEFLAKRLLEFHVTKFDLSWYNSPLKGKVADRDLITAEYNKWAQKNIFKSDIKLNFSTMMNLNQIQAWCHSYDLPFHTKNALEWITHFEHYSRDVVQ